SDRELADGVTEGRFSHIGITLELGVEPDWFTTAIPVDEEWRREWSKFGYGRQLGQAFAEAGGARYLRTQERPIRPWTPPGPVEHDDSYVTARRIQNWLQAWSFFAGARAVDGFGAEFADELFASLKDQVAHLRAHISPERNHRTLELFALFL